VVLALFSVAGISGWFLYRSSRRQWARYEAIPLVHALAEKGDYSGAYRLMLDLDRYIPDDAALRHLWPEVSRNLSVHSDPPGAEVTWKPYAVVG
jgi:hypothetical protein